MEEDVAAVMEFPRGNMKMTKKPLTVLGELILKWRVIFHRKDAKITPSELYSVMEAKKDGGVWFKRHFAMLVVSIFIDTPGNGYCNHQFMHYFEDVSKIKELNWCDLLLRSLVLYVDRVVFISRNVPQALLAFIGWNSDLLQERQTKEVKVWEVWSRFCGSPDARNRGPTIKECAVTTGTTGFKSQAHEIRYTIWEIAKKLSTLARL